MTFSVLYSLGCVYHLGLLLLTWSDVGLIGSFASPERHHRPFTGRQLRKESPLHQRTASRQATGLLSQLLSTLNLTDHRGPQIRPRSVPRETPEYMLELYDRFTNDFTALPSANIVRSFKNEDSSPSRVTVRGTRIHPLLFNISIPSKERVRLAELRLHTMLQSTQSSVDCKVTVYKVHEGVRWTKEMGAERRRGGQEVLVETKDLEELVTNRIHARDNKWLSFDLTHVINVWRASGCSTQRLEVHVESRHFQEGGTTPEVTEEDRRSVDVDIKRNLESKENAVIIVFSEDRSREHRQKRKEPGRVIDQENGLPDDPEENQHTVWEHLSKRDGHSYREDSDRLQSNSIYDTQPRFRRDAEGKSCRRSPLYVFFKDIGWHWIIQPAGYEAYMCNGVCNPPMTSEVSPTKHAIIQTLLSLKHPEKVSRACCVPTKLDSIPLMYHDNDVITYNPYYEGMVVAECGCR